MNTPGATATPRDAATLAAAWCMRLREAPNDPALRSGLEAWLSAAPGNAATYARVSRALDMAEAAADAPQLRALRAQTLARAGQRRDAVRHRRAWALVASLALAAGVGALALLRPGAAPLRMWQDARDAFAGNVYKTDVGQRSVVRLDDGSVVTLNTDSRLSVHYGDRIRGVTLERGQALFKVAKDPAHPFVVTAGGRQVTALGTEFDVLLSRRAFEVTLLEGRVAVTRATQAVGKPQRPLAELQPGQQYVAIASTRPQVRATDVRRVVSWQRGQVVFENERLDDAVAEMNRYSRQQVVLQGGELATLRISGAFNAGDVGTFVQALSDYFPIEHDAPDAQTVVLRPRRDKHG